MRRRLTCTSAFAVAVLVVAQLAAHAHAAVARHITCEEHGEQLEAAIVAAHPDDGVARWVGVEGAAEHDECLLANALRQGGIAPAHAQLAVALAAIDLPRPPPRTVARPVTAALYRLAPKTSPPRTA